MTLLRKIFNPREEGREEKTRMKRICGGDHKGKAAGGEKEGFVGFQQLLTSHFTSPNMACTLKKKIPQFSAAQNHSSPARACLTIIDNVKLNQQTPPSHAQNCL